LKAPLVHLELALTVYHLLLIYATTSEVIHRCNRYLNNRLEQDHRGIKQRYYPMRGFASFASASRFCRAFDEVGQFFRLRTSMKQKVSLVQQRDLFRQRLDALKAMVPMA
jgi:putative transposase